MFIDSLSKKYKKHDVPENYLVEWQSLLDHVAELFQVNAALIKRVHSEKLEILTSSNSKGNPFKACQTDPLNSGLFCEYVMERREALDIPDIRKAEDWMVEAAKKPVMISYLGLPLIWPDGDVFGTICILNGEEKTLKPIYQDMLIHYKDLIERDLKIFDQNKELKKANRMLDERSADLSYVNKELEAFSYSVSHDLRSPLSLISGYSHLLREQIRDYYDEEANKLLGKIDDSTFKMSVLIEKLLSLSKVENDELELSSVDLSLIARKKLKSYQGLNLIVWWR